MCAKAQQTLGSRRKPGPSKTAGVNGAGLNSICWLNFLRRRCADSLK